MPVVRQKYVLSLLLLASAQLWAQSSTSTTLSFSSASVTWKTPVTLTATVKAGANPVTPGLVRFCNANASNCLGPGLLAQAQLTASGTASIKLALAIGSHSIKAEFAGTKTDAASSSTAETLTVTGPRSSSTTLIANANPPYALTATVNGFGSQAPTGNVSFIDTSDNSFSLGTAALGAATTTQAFVPQVGTGAGSEPVALAVGDFNGDGYPDIVVGDVNAGSVASTLAVYLSTGTGSYSGPITVNLPGSVNGVSALAVGDFNNDGKLDLAVASGNAYYVTILLGDGTGHFNYVSALPTGTDPNSIAVADFNGDGNADLAITNQFSSSVTILLGNGEGGFSEAPSSPATGSFPYSIATGDFNGDGKPDLAIANYYGFDVTVLLGNGDGTFTPAASSPSTGVYPDSIAVGDFNGDGKLDLAVSNQFSKTITVLLGDGKGDFTATSQSPATGLNPDSVATSDFNGDGIEDLAVANSNDNTVTVLLGKGDGTFPTTQKAQLPTGTAPYSVAASDFNADGLEDFVVAGSGNNTVVIALNTVTTTASATLAGVKVLGGGTHTIEASYPGNGTYGASASSIPLPAAPIATTLALSAAPSTAAVGEPVQLTAIVSPSIIDDLIPSGSVTFSNGTATLATVPVAFGIAVYNYTVPAAGMETITAKYSGDSNFLPSVSGTAGFTAIATQASTTTLTVSSSSVTKGTPVTFTAAVVSNGKPVTQGSVSFCNAASRFCEDATLLGTEQLTANGTAVLNLTLPIGTTSVKAVFLRASQFLSSVSAAKTVTVTAASNTATTNTLALTGAPGKYTLTSTVSGSWPAPTGNISFVDTSNNNLPLGMSFLTPGFPNFAQSAALSTGMNPESIAVADFNGDGKPDLAVANTDSNTVTIFLGNGAGTFTAKASAIIGTPDFNTPYRIVPGDFNGDGEPDLAVSNTGAGNVIILLGNGDGTFTVKSTPAVGQVPFGIAAADFNGDGKQDLAVVNRGSSTVTILLGNGDGTFTADPVSPPTQAGAYSIVTADFNQDGKADLAIANEFTNNLTVLLGNGDGTFVTSPVFPQTGAVPLVLAVGDFNQDGVPDLAVVNFSDLDVSILLGKGDGTFTQSAVIPTGTNPQGIVAGDFNGDGLTDLAVTNASASSLTLLFGQGAGQFFSQTVPLAAGSGPIPIAAGDFNQDGGPDLAVGDVNSNTVRILLNSATAVASVNHISVPGSGTHELAAIYAGAPPYLGSTSSPVAATASPISTAVFLSAPIALIGQSVPITATVFPISADNFTVSGTVSLYNGSTLLGTATLANGQAPFSMAFASAGAYNLTAKFSGSANFSSSSSAPTPVYVASGTSISLSASANSVSFGTPVTLTATISSGGKPVTQGFVTFFDGSTQLATADLTTSGSAIAKLVLGIGSHSLKAVYAATAAAAGASSGTQTVTVTGLYATTTTLTDSVVSGKYTLTATVNGANTQTPSGNVSFLNTTSNATLGTAALSTGTTALSFSTSILAVGLGPQAIGIADFNRDGNLDLAVVNAGSNTVTILLGNGNGTFTVKSTVTVNADPAAIAVGDFNADGIPDLAVANFVSDNVSILTGNGDGTFTLKSTLSPGGEPIGLAVGDFNLDGKLDLAVTNNFGDAVLVFAGHGDGTFAAPSSFASGLSVPRGVAVADFNGDGKPDLAIANYDGDTITVLLGDGNGSFVQSASVPTGSLPWPVVVGDFNGDGKLDLATANNDGTLTIALGNGNGTFGSPPSIPLPGYQPQPQGLVAADFNQDGKLDLAVPEFGTNQVTILLGNGDGTFNLQSNAIPTGSQPWSIAFGDFNHDGKPDLAVPNNVTVLLNTLSTSATATLTGVTLSGTGNQSIQAKYPGLAPYAASASNLLSLSPP